MKTKIVASLLLVSSFLGVTPVDASNKVYYENHKTFSEQQIQDFFHYYTNMLSKIKEKEDNIIKVDLDVQKVTLGNSEEQNEINENIEERQEELKQEERQEVVFDDVNETVWTTTSVNIRKGPSKDDDKITTLSIATPITRIGIGDNGWSKIIYKDIECYINSKYISTIEVEKPIEEVITPTITTNLVPFIQKEGNVNDSFIILANEEYNKILPNVKTFLKNNNIQIYITDTNLAKRFYDGVYNSVMGVTLFGSNTIYIEDREKAVKNSLIHESGHIVDSELGFASLNNEFIELYNLESQSFTQVAGSYAATNPTEYFAEMFYFIHINPSACEKYAPQTYAYIMNLINNV